CATVRRARTPTLFPYTTLFRSGVLAGRRYAVLDHRIATDGVILVLPPEMPMPAMGDAFSIVAGCDKLFATCKAKFGNAENFRGRSEEHTSELQSRENLVCRLLL